MTIDTTTTTTDAAPAEVRSSRRNLLRLAGAAAVGGAATTLLASGSADAASVAWMTEVNTNTTVVTTLSSSASRSLVVNNTNGTGEAVLGVAKTNGTGVRGAVDASAGPDAYGVWGDVLSNVGFGVVASGGSSQLRLLPNAGFGLPVTSTDKRGALHVNATGLFFCATGDAANGDTWTTLADSASSGVLHAVGPWRVYDSRKAAPGPQGPLTSGNMRAISVKDARDVNTGAVTVPDVVWAGAKAIAYNVTVVNTVGSNGFLAINMGDNTTVTASAINWSAPNLTLANASLVRLNNSREIMVICGGSSTSCHFIIDVVGFYR